MHNSTLFSYSKRCRFMEVPLYNLQLIGNYEMSVYRSIPVYAVPLYLYVHASRYFSYQIDFGFSSRISFLRSNPMMFCFSMKSQPGFHPEIFLRGAIKDFPFFCGTSTHAKPLEISIHRGKGGKSPPLPLNKPCQHNFIKFPSCPRPGFSFYRGRGAVDIQFRLNLFDNKYAYSLGDKLRL